MNKYIIAVAGLSLTLGACAASPKKDVTQETTLAAGDPGPSPTLGAEPPAGDDVVVLFDGSAWGEWTQRDGAPSQWIVMDDGSARVNGGDAVTMADFGDFRLHLEFLCPEMPEKEGQARANSGVYVHGRYEVQVLDSFGLEPAMGSCGAVYSISPPRRTASRPPGEWQTYDMVVRAPTLDDDGAMTKPGAITVALNGVIIQNNLILTNTTPGGLDGEFVARGPLLLQDHHDPVRYRNIWVVELD